MFNAIIKFNPKLYSIPSVNSMYIIRRGGKGLCLNPDASKFKEFVRFELLKQGIHNYFKDKKDIVIELEMIVIFKNNFWKRDISNTIKACEDAISEATKINDTYNFRVASRKIINDKDENEYLIITMKETNKDETILAWSDVDNLIL